MKATLGFVVLCLMVLVVGAVPALAGDCDCTAPDESCSASSGLVTLSGKGLTSGDLASVLSNQLGAEVNFIAGSPGEAYDVDISAMPAAELRQVLAEYGSVSNAADPEIERRAALMHAVPSANVSLHLEKTTAAQVVAILSQLLGDAKVSLMAEDPHEELSIDVADSDLESLIRGLEATSSIRLVLDEKP